MEFISSALSSMNVLSMFASHDKDLNGFLHVHQWMSSISVISLQYPFASTLRRSLNPELRRFISNRCKTSTYNSFLCYNVIVLIAIFTTFFAAKYFNIKTGPMIYFVDTFPDMSINIFMKWIRKIVSNENCHGPKWNVID